MRGVSVAAQTLRRTLARMIRIGLTGNIASGKTEVADLLGARGATIVDADELAREVVAPGTEALERIRERWGDDIVSGDGTLKRDELRQRVFSDAEQLEALNAIVHPEIARLRDERIAAAREAGVKVLVYVAPLLFERHLADEFDKIVLVDAPRELRFDRLVRVRGVDEAEAMNMIAAQMPAELKRARADYIIDNIGSLEDLRAGVERVWRDLEREASRELASL
jgi:dephospho-CoA kinase